MPKPLYKVYTTEPTNFGDEEVSIKIFKNLPKAKLYFKKLVKERKEDSKETDDTFYVGLYEIYTNQAIDNWQSGDE